MIPFSILDLSPITEGATAAEAFRNSVALARRAEELDYKRFWVAEHHNMPGIASAATAVVIGHIAGATKTIRVGAGGIMLPNHSPLVVAEQFGTLAALYPDRIDLGLGRAPGTDPLTARALRRDLATHADEFPRDVEELLAYFEPAEAGRSVRAIPGVGLGVPLWILGSSIFGAQLAAALGLPYAFASHFAPGDMMEALALYRRRFHPSKYLERPYAMIGVNVVAAATDAEARRLFTSLQQAFTNLRRGMPSQLPPPVDDIDVLWTPQEKAMSLHSLAVSAVGSAETVERGLEKLLDMTGADELMLTAHIYDQAARLRSFEIAAQVRDKIGRHEYQEVAGGVRKAGRHS